MAFYRGVKSVKGGLKMQKVEIRVIVHLGDSWEVDSFIDGLYMDLSDFENCKVVKVEEV